MPLFIRTAPEQSDTLIVRLHVEDERVAALNLKSKEETIKLCDEEIRKALLSLHMDPSPNATWHWEMIDRWLDIRISLMRKVGQI